MCVCVCGGGGLEIEVVGLVEGVGILVAIYRIGYFKRYSVKGCMNELHLQNYTCQFRCGSGFRVFPLVSFVVVVFSFFCFFSSCYYYTFAVHLFKALFHVRFTAVILAYLISSETYAQNTNEM